jgi:hypothetical protein
VTNGYISTEYKVQDFKTLHIEEIGKKIVKKKVENVSSVLKIYIAVFC